MPSIPNADRTSPALPRDIQERLAATVKGMLIEPTDREYDEARKVWNAMFDDRRPAAVVRCADEEDVRQAILALRSSELPVAVRGGGHHIAGFGTCDGGVVIDLGQMRKAELGDGGSRVAVSGGATLHEVDTATASVDRAVPLGVVSETGVGGLTLSGGVGWLTRLYGYTCDNLVSAQVVTAVGESVRASETENEDLLWALRGGGGNFGVVTEFEYRTHPVSGVTVAEAYHLVEDDREVEDTLRFYRDWSSDLPREVTAWIVIQRVTDEHDMLVGSEGKLVVCLVACCVGSVETGEAQLAPLLNEGAPTASRLTPMRMVDLQHLQDESGAAAKGMRGYMKGEMITELTDPIIAAIAERSQEPPSVASLFEMGMLGGAMAERSELDAAVGLRSARYIGGFSMMTADPDEVEAGIEWARAAWAPMREASAGGTYLNFSGEENSERVLGSLGATDLEKQRKLLDLKRRYDPENFFRINHNIRPD